MGTGTINAVGIWFYCITTQKYLYLMRNDSKHFGSWGLAGGKVLKKWDLCLSIHN